MPSPAGMITESSVSVTEARRGAADTCSLEITTDSIGASASSTALTPSPMTTESMRVKFPWPMTTDSSSGIAAEMSDRRCR